MNSKRIICLLLSFVVFASCLTGCGEDETQVYNGDAEILSLASGVIAANDKLEFYWDNDLKCVLLKNNETGKM